MTVYVAFLRAINLGARRKFPKADLVRVVQETGASDVAVHLNTGNVRLGSRQRSPEAVARTLEAAFAADRGFAVPTLVLTLDELRCVIEDARRVAQGSRLEVAEHYVSLLREEPSPESAAAYSAVVATGEEAHVIGRAVHLLVDQPAAYRTAKLPAVLERHLGVATNRNLRVTAELDRRWGGG